MLPPADSRAHRKRGRGIAGAPQRLTRRAAVLREAFDAGISWPDLARELGSVEPPGTISSKRVIDMAKPREMRTTHRNELAAARTAKRDAEGR